MSGLLSPAEHYTISATHLETAAQHQEAAARHMLGGNADQWAHHVKIADGHVAVAAAHADAANKQLERQHCVVAPRPDLQKMSRLSTGADQK